ncbi:MAG: class I SAM-dependent methyltransferase, partial [Pseudomonadota bacterium]
ITAYSQLFANYRERRVRILEIGIQNGGSLEVWSKYFPNAVAIVGCDIDEKCRDLVYDDPRISVIVGDANDPKIFAQVCEISDTFDIIIDDGSHISGDIVRAFSRFFPIVSPGGVFVAEDLHCSYWSAFEGGLEDPASALSFFRRLADLTNKEHWGGPLSAADSLSFFADRHGCTFDEMPLLGVSQVAFFNSLAVVHRGTPEDRALGTRIVVGQEAIVSTASVGLHGTSCPEFPQIDNPAGPMAQRRERLDTILLERDQTLLERDQTLLERDQTIADFDTALSRLQHDHATLEAEYKLRTDEAFMLREKLAQARGHVSQTAKAYVAYKLLSALARSPLPLGSQTRDRFARSAAKRDPRRSLHDVKG